MTGGSHGHHPDAVLPVLSQICDPVEIYVGRGLKFTHHLQIGRGEEITVSLWGGAAYSDVLVTQRCDMSHPHYKTDVKRKEKGNPVAHKHYYHRMQV